MTEQKTEDHIIMLSNARVAFPEFFEAKQVGGKGTAAFSGCFLLPPDHPDVVKVKTGIAAVAKAKWPQEFSTILPVLIAGDKVCLHNGDLKANYDGFPGNLYVSARGKMRPLVIAQDRTPLTAADGKPYSGCYVNVQIALWAQDNQYGKRVNAQIRGVQFLRDGDAFGGGSVAQADEFEPVDDSADADAPVADGWGDMLGDDDIPF